MSNKPTDLKDFFSTQQNTVRQVRALGIENWDMDGKITVKLYEATMAPASDQNKIGVVPSVLQVDPQFLPRLKVIDSWPCVLECEIQTVAGSKNKSTNHIVGIKFGTA